MVRPLYRALASIGVGLLTLTPALATGVAGAVAAPAADGGTLTQPAGSVRLISARADGSPGGQASGEPRLSDDGRWVVFQSATAFVRRDTNAADDVYLVDRSTGRKTLVSRSFEGGSANNRSQNPDISADGRFITYNSAATDIMPGVAAGGLYRYDRVTGEQILVARSGFHSAVSDDGRYVAFNRPSGIVYLADVQSGAKLLVSHHTADPSEPVSQSWRPRISADGRFITYYGYYDTLAANDKNGVRDVFLWDRTTNDSTLVSTAESGFSGNGGSDDSDISADGRRVVFTSMASDLVDGVAFGDPQVYVKNMTSGVIRLVSVNARGEPATGDDFTMSFLPVISPDGGSVAFLSTADDLVRGARTTTMDTYVRHIGPRITELASHDPRGNGANAPSGFVAISEGGESVAFTTDATDLSGAEQDQPRRQVFVFRSAMTQD